MAGTPFGTGRAAGRAGLRSLLLELRNLPGVLRSHLHTRWYGKQIYFNHQTLHLSGTTFVCMLHYLKGGQIILSERR